MSESVRESSARDVSIDRIKAIACVLVSVGHFFMSMSESGLLPESGFYNWFISTLYTFHVPLFFICSGYLYKEESRTSGRVLGRVRFLADKLVSLGIPFVVFSTFTYVIKILFSSQVNTQVNDSYFSIYVVPISPYWYLYVLFCCFVITPPFQRKSGTYSSLACFFLIKTIFCFIGEDNLPYIVEKLIDNEFWFLLGMALRASGLKRRLGVYTAVIGAAFAPASLIMYWGGFYFQIIRFWIGILACLFIFSIVNMCENRKNKKIMNFLIRYNMPIFLMHTIFAAAMRTILLLLGIRILAVHIIFGLVVSFAGPGFAGWAFKKFGKFNYLIYPPKIFARDSNLHKSRGVDSTEK